MILTTYMTHFYYFIIDGDEHVLELGDTVIHLMTHNPEATSVNCYLFPNVGFNMIDDDHLQNDYN